MKIALSTDHAGFEAVKQLKVYLEELGYEVVDYGPTEYEATDDYPDFIFPAAHAVANGECEVGIIFGGSGQGEAMVANRVAGVRCGVYYGTKLAYGPIDADGTMSDDAFEILKLNRQHNHANMLSIGSRFVGFEEVKQAVKIWLDTPWSDDERHTRRVRKIDA
jgi:ribose 5-phosphate isomerase B